MWSYLLILVLAGLSLGGNPPKKQFNFDLEQEVQIKQFIDPIDGISYRLPNDTYPLHYDVSIKTDVHNADFAFTGKVDILLEVRTSTFQIILQQRQLTIIKIDLFDFNGNAVQEDVQFTEGGVEEFLIVPSPRILATGEQYRLSIEFSGILREDTSGFYRSSYQNAQGQTVWLATTQFESTDARHGFPCWDEPGIRSTFAIEIEHHASYTALSNMPVISRESTSTTHVLTKFQTTPRIQTYIIAYVISDFISVNNFNVRTHQRVFATPAQIENGLGNFALEFGVNCLQTFERHLRVEYMLPKLDQISIPNFEKFGAMENFGKN